jgi:hypothetical protein
MGGGRQRQGASVPSYADGLPHPPQSFPGGIGPAFQGNRLSVGAGFNIHMCIFFFGLI